VEKALLASGWRAEASALHWAACHAPQRREALRTQECSANQRREAPRRAESLCSRARLSSGRQLAMLRLGTQAP
jgi:hypothetical protein